jgi:pimeloyl-ACP methyl ester carboxylesterase
VRAARQLPTAQAGSDYIVWGHSEGGQAALFAWNMAGTYGAREGIRMVGAVSVAPPSHLQDVYDHLSGSSNRVYDYMMLAGFNGAYGSRAAPLDAVLTSKGTALLSKLRTACLAPVTAAVNAQPYTQLVKKSPFAVPAWRQLFSKNDPATFATANYVPLLIVHGAADEVIPASTSAQLAGHLCTLAANLERWVYPDQNHGGVLFASAVDMGHWMENRFQNSSDPYQPTGAAGVQVHTCR